MATNLMLDDDLIAQAMEAGHHLTKRETVNEVLRSYGAFLQQQRILTSSARWTSTPSTTTRLSATVREGACRGLRPLPA
jgi:Arc/MetJ family transcription regulator